VTATLATLCDHALATYGFRASGRQHLVQHHYADSCLSLLRGEAARSQPRSDQRLVATHRRFDQRALAIICCFLPGQSSLFHDDFQMAITLCGRTGFIVQYGR
jgi:hypothetical protein